MAVVYYELVILAIVLVFFPLISGGRTNVVSGKMKGYFELTKDYYEALQSGLCYEGRSSNGYAGKVATTVKGKTCQRWDQQFPHYHSYTNNDAYPDDSISDAENYCRDPSNSGFTWCYTTDWVERWEPCNVTKCELDFNPDGCYRFNETANDYKGHLDVTIHGRKCQTWSSQYPHKHNYSVGFPDGNIYASRNYCRDPDNWGHPWCYTTDPEKRWEVCDIARCGSFRDTYTTVHNAYIKNKFISSRNLKDTKMILQ